VHVLDEGQEVECVCHRRRAARVEEGPLNIHVCKQTGRTSRRRQTEQALPTAKWSTGKAPVSPVGSNSFETLITN